ncbi:bifunctional transcriptional activator/DNA repair enzyme AdaA [Sphingobacterium paludis]|jgi:AraC family transcriptional regulator, regulatory protein of adaptative response / methylated-DNA-[protein]-cysteine methyltransferase|uniref:methylated-DNA--[protein]-cysteine S-methyltransferase n=1 Tax=Sphingobacterium paludis TaxID=1476465 RepID=A0A4R7CY72_9SPHI|nr:methylated-DNA--[protein]-cysteine S-methyltransferase [Sphingobacterium paludis]TDS11064.1 AraC family transcriptional regulator of adaptative response/methylated-DNA-[protein]-cysteine methyltransferase [Sphingobacterium paludis]
METQQDILNFNRIAEAIAFVQTNYKSQPSLSSIADHVHVSPEHFQRIFQEWAGVSPKKFLQYTSIQHAKQLLLQEQSNLFDAAYHTGLSSTSRLHDLFIKIEGMTPAEYQQGGKQLLIHYASYPSPFGDVFVASTAKGICYVAFESMDHDVSETLFAMYPNARFIAAPSAIHQAVLAFFNRDWSDLKEVKLHLRGTPFQLHVWEALLKIPAGQLLSYQHIAKRIGRSAASRAVGTAIGSNPIAYLIPCHRVIQTSGLLGGYRWGLVRKTALIAWESALTWNNTDETI